MCQHLEMVPPANGCEATSKKASAPRLAIWPAYRESFASQRSSHCLVDNPGARPPGPYHLGRWPRRGGIQFHRTLSFFGTGHTKILSFSLQEKRQHPLIKFYGHSLGTADYSYFQAIFDQIDLYGGNTTLYFLHAPRITPVFLRRFGCEFR